MSYRGLYLLNAQTVGVDGEWAAARALAYCDTA
jgi:hypothetical protein